MSINILLKEIFIFLFFLFGPISFAQEVESTVADQSGNNSSGVDRETVADQEPIKCFEYSGYIVNRITGNPISDATIEVNSDDGLVTIIRTDQSGYYNFIMPCKEKNKLVISAQAYSKEMRIVRAGETPKAPSTNNRIYLTPFDSLVENADGIEKIKIDPIYFESNKSTTLTWDKKALEKVLFTMLKFPEIRIKIKYHSNAGGSNISNAVISYFRTKAARRYLILQGIDPNRIESTHGYDTGSSENNCPNCEGQEPVNNSLSTFIIVSN